MTDAVAQFEQYRISKFGEPYLYSVNRSTFEKNTAKVTFDSFYRKKFSDENYFYIILGCDSGLLIDYIIENQIAKGSRYLFIDSTHVIENLNSQLSFTSWNDKVSLCSFDEWEDKIEELNLQAYMYTNRVRYVKSTAATDEYASYYHQYNISLSMQLEQLQHVTKVSLYRAQFVVKQIENLAENINPMSDLENKFSGMDCIVLGGGPSLDEIIEQLKSLDNNVVIFAVSRIAKRLISENIKPHFIVSVDPNEVSFDVSKEMLQMADSSIFLHSTYVVPSLLGQWNGINFNDGQRVPWPSKLLKENINMVGPTVTNCALSVATELGFKRIFLSGVDLCYASNGLTHAQGSNEAKVGPVLGKREQWVKTYDGKLAETMMTFLHASKTIQSQAEYALEKGCHFYNLSPNAAAIDNISQINFEKINFIKTDKTKEIFADIRAQYGQKDIKQYKSVLKDIDRLTKELNEIARIIKKAIKDNKALYKTYASEEKNAQIKQRIDQAEKKLTGKYDETTTFLKKYAIHRFIQIARTDGDEEWTDEEMEEIGDTYYQCFIQTIDGLKPVLVSAKKRIESRLQEYREQKNYQPLLEQWKNDKQFGRAYNWKLANEALFSQLDDEVKAQFEQHIEKYFEILKNTDTAHLKRTKAHSSLDGVNRKAVYMFGTKNSDGLSHLIDNLKKLTREEPDLESLINLCSAYNALLNQQPEQAIDFFNAINSKHIAEDELVQMSAIEIQLQNYQKAESHLKTLASLTSIHMPKYATILKLNGKTPESINVLHDYLELTPQDIKARLSLGKLYIDIQDIAQAKKAFSQIIIQDPENVEAQHFIEILAQ